MLKVRVMPTLLYRGSGLVKGVEFDAWRPVGAVLQAIRVYNLREVDELIFLDIEATRQERSPDYALIEEFADDCFMPLTVGGGVRTVEHVERLLAVGADKVALNTAALEVPTLVAAVADRFGAQCVVASVDARAVPYPANGTAHLPRAWETVTRSGTHATGCCPIQFCRQLESDGAGEILLTSVDRDGTMRGYDIELCQRVADAVDIPVIASGGAGKVAHFVDVLRDARIGAVAAASLFHFTETTPLEIKTALAAAGFPVRGSSVAA